MARLLDHVMKRAAPTCLSFASVTKLRKTETWRGTVELAVSLCEGVSQLHHPEFGNCESYNLHTISKTHISHLSI